MRGWQIKKIAAVHCRFESLISGINICTDHTFLNPQGEWWNVCEFVAPFLKDHSKCFTAVMEHVIAEHCRGERSIPYLLSYYSRIHHLCPAWDQQPPYSYSYVYFSTIWFTYSCVFIQPPTHTLSLKLQVFLYVFVLFLLFLTLFQFNLPTIYSHHH